MKVKALILTLVTLASLGVTVALWFAGSLTPKNYEITRKASNGFIFLSKLKLVIARYS